LHSLTDHAQPASLLPIISVMEVVYPSIADPTLTFQSNSALAPLSLPHVPISACLLKAVSLASRGTFYRTEFVRNLMVLPTAKLGTLINQYALSVF